VLADARTTRFSTARLDSPFTIKAAGDLEERGLLPGPYLSKPDT